MSSLDFLDINFLKPIFKTPYDELVPLDFFVALVRDENIDVRVSYSVSYQTLTLNCDRFPTNITAFRRAMAFGMDKYRIDVQGDLGFPQDSYIPRIVTKWEVESQLNEHFYEADFIAGNASLENAGFKDLDDDLSEFFFGINDFNDNLTYRLQALFLVRYYHNSS